MYPCFLTMESWPTIPDPASWHFQEAWCSPEWPKVHLNPVPGLVLPKGEDQDLGRHCGPSSLSQLLALAT